MTKREFDKLRKLLIKYNKIRHDARMRYLVTRDIEAYTMYIDYTCTYIDLSDFLKDYE